MSRSLFIKLFHCFNNNLSLCLDNFRGIKENQSFFFMRKELLICKRFCKGIAREFSLIVCIWIFTIDVEGQVKMWSSRISRVPNNAHLISCINMLLFPQKFS